MTDVRRHPAPDPPPDFLRDLIRELGLETYRKAPNDPQLWARLEAAKWRLEFTRKLGGGTALGKMAGYPFPRIELPNLHAAPDLRVSRLLLRDEYHAALQKAESLWMDRPKHNRVAWEQRLRTALFPSLGKHDPLPACSSPSATAYASVKERHHQSIKTIKRRIGTLPKTWKRFLQYLPEEARAWQGDDETIRRLHDLGFEVNRRDVTKFVQQGVIRVAATGRPRRKAKRTPRRRHKL
jgi:hypothetical protein